MLPSSHTDSFARDRLPPQDQLPVFIAVRPELDYPDQINCAVELVDRHVREGRGDRIALHGVSDFNKGGDFSWTYAQLQDKSNRIAQVLTHDMGLVPGNRILLRGGNSPMMAACLLGALKAGLVAVPTMPLLRAGELAQIIDKAQVSAALCDSLLADELQHCMTPGHASHMASLQQLVQFRSDAPDGLEQRMAQQSGAYTPHATSRDDVCLIAFTSGTTGKPKGTMHFHRDVLAMCDLFPRHILQMNENDVVCGTPPIAFTFGLGGLLAFPLRYGASTMLLEKHTPETLMQTIAKYRATQCYTAPTMYRQMATLAKGVDLSSLKHPVSAGEALPDATRQLWKQATGIEMTDGIGGTEVIHIYISSAGAQVRPGSIGQVVPGYVAQIVGEDMQSVPPGTVGRLAVRGPTGCKYLDDPRQQDYVKAGWNLPGDTFVMDADGYFSYQARNDDMIISAGYNIAGPEVESALLQHPAVAECGVVGMPDEDRGHIVQAYVVLKPGHTGDAAMEKALQEHVKQTIAPFKYPRKVIFLDALPRTETGKLQRFKLRQISS
ncbi:AMP-binding protein [Limnohabitans sp. JUR4]|uniref:AMP-binding protein n=1 Tax=Limnohabitans radicicola TaxID=2771427 RepID=A0A927IKY8_9BURK|nr:AMP-binding protein [Limnohabitans radicicola]MBD8049610.1 AMP-binding protein [Limnohabitans radicicola]